MIKRNLIQPSIAVNAQGAQPYFNMERNFEIASNFPSALVFGYIKSKIEERESKTINALVVHCHGQGVINKGSKWTDKLPLELQAWKLGLSFGFGLAIGSGGINNGDANLFGSLKGLVSEIYITGCGVAAVTKGYEGGDGIAFCKEIAKYSGASVYASDATQWTFNPFNFRLYGQVIMDGTVYRFSPDGNYRIET